MSIDEEIKIKQNAQVYYEKDLSYNQVYRQGVIDGYAKAIDEFADQLKKKYEHCVVNDILMNNDVMSYTNSCSVFESFIDEIAEEMRGAING